MPLPPFLASSAPSMPEPSAERLGALYAFTRAQRQANPDGYARNVQWWSGALGSAMAAGWGSSATPGGTSSTPTSTRSPTPTPLAPALDTLVLRVDEALLARLENDKGGRPRGIGGVVDALTTNAPLPTFLQLARFLSAPTPLEASPSITSRLASAGWGALARLSPFGGGEATEDQLWKAARGGEYVYTPGVKTAARKFTEHIAANPPVSYTDSLHTRASFQKAFGAIATPGTGTLSKRDVDVLLRWLERDAGSVVVDGDTVKILLPGQIPAEHPITEADRGAVQVAATLAQVDAQAAAAETQAAECTEKARKQLSLGHRASATAYLRSKKGLEEVAARRIGAGEQLRGVLRAIDQAKGDAEVMSAYELSTAALATALKDPRLDRDHIAATTDALADALADQKEIDDAVRLGGELAVGPSDADDDELEKELAALVIEEKERQEEEKERARLERIDKERRDKEDRERKEREEKERQAKEDKERKEKEDRERADKAKAAQAESLDWAQRHEDAQQREREERERAEAERLRREEEMVAVE